MLIIFSILKMTMGQTGNFGFSNFGVLTTPLIVSAPANLEYLIQTRSTTGFYATGDTITFDLPGGYFIESTDLAGCTSLSEGITFSSCVTTRQRAVVTLSCSLQANELWLTLNNYINPYSTTPVSGLKTTLRNATHTRAYH